MTVNNGNKTMARGAPTHPRLDAQRAFDDSSRVRERLNETTINIGSRHAGRQWEAPHPQDTTNFVNEAFMPKFIVHPPAQIPTEPAKNKRPRLYVDPARTSIPEYQQAVDSNQALPKASHRPGNSIPQGPGSESSSPRSEYTHTAADRRQSENQGRLEDRGGARSLMVENAKNSILNILPSRTKSGGGQAQSDDEDDRGWDIEPKVPAKPDAVDPTTEKDASREKVLTTIEKMSEPWKLIFDQAADVVKSDYQNLATHIGRLLENDAILSKGMATQLELSSATASGSINKMVDDFGEALESVVQIQTANEAMQAKLSEFEQESRDAKKGFLKRLSKCQARHAEEVGEMRAEIEAEKETFEGLIQMAKSDKNEKKDMQKRLAVLLADES